MNKLFVAAALLASFGLAGCEWESDSGKPNPPKNAWQKLGSTTLKPHVHDHYARPMLRDGDLLYIGTPNGLLRYDLRGNAWQPLALEGFAVHALTKSGTSLFAAGVGKRDVTQSLFRSSDAGKTWVSAARVPTVAKSLIAEPIYDMVAVPNNPQRLYFNFSGASIGVSTDGGQSIKLVNDQTDVFFGYHCHVQFIDNKADKLFQGCEAPLDDAWVAEYRLDASKPDQIGNGRKIASGWDDKLPKLENRRPNSMASHRSHGEGLYVGVEGGLVRFDGDAMQWLYKSQQSGTQTVPYAYIRAIGLDRQNPKRVLFGGQLNGDNRVLQLHLTEDAGKTTRQIAGPEGLKESHVLAIEPDGAGSWLILIAHHPSAAEQQLQVYRYRG